MNDIENSIISPNFAQTTQKPVDIGAKILAQSGFNERHNIVESSFNKALKQGEKLSGKNGERRSKAYLNRLDQLIQKNGNEFEKKLWQKSSDNLIIQPENIPESYWEQQEQIYRDLGHGDIRMDSHNKQLIIDDTQKRQRESIKSWSNYLGDENTPYPLWFKCYAWDGVSKMGAFNKEKQYFNNRDNGTVAPYPNCNAAVLAKVYNAITDFYDNDERERYSEDDKKQAEMEALVKSGNFNRLYSKILIEQKAITKTPERTEDIHGQWITYAPGQEKEIAAAAEGTPWCVADPNTARGYLNYGHFGIDHNTTRRYSDDSNKARFIFFHIDNPDTATLSETACASIRLDKNGNVTEISGLDKGQALEESLVPIVEAKVKTLPGGEKFLQAFADKQELIKLDRKMKNSEPLTEEELNFVYETNRDIVILDTYNDIDPRMHELKIAYLDEALNKIDSVAIINTFMKDGEYGCVMNNLDKFITAGADPTNLASMLCAEDVANNLDILLNAGADIDPTDLVERLVRHYEVKALTNNLDKFINAGVDPTTLAKYIIRNSMTYDLIDNLDKFVNAGADPMTLVDYILHQNGAAHAGANMNAYYDFIDMGKKMVIANLDKFVAAGADRAALMNKLHLW